MAEPQELIDVGPLRERFLELEAKGLKAAECGEWLAERLDWKNETPAHRHSRFKRLLGLAPYRCGDAISRKRKRVSRHLAAETADILGMDPWESGL